MKKLRVIYNATFGLVVADGLVMDTVNAQVEDFRQGDRSKTVVVASDVMISAFRIAVLEDRLKPEEIEFQFGSEIVPCNEYGRLTHHPYNDISCQLAVRLINGASQKRKRLSKA